MMTLSPLKVKHIVLEAAASRQLQYSVAHTNMASNDSQEALRLREVSSQEYKAQKSSRTKETHFINF